MQHKAKTARHIRYHNASRELGCIVTGSHNVQMHHCWGRKFVTNKVWVGEDAILILDFDLHDVMSNNPLNVTHHKKAFHAKYGSNAELIRRTLDNVEKHYGSELLPEQHVIDAMMIWGRVN